MKTNYSIIKGTIIALDKDFGLFQDYLGHLVMFDMGSVHKADMNCIKEGSTVLWNSLGLLETPGGAFKRTYGK